MCAMACTYFHTGSLKLYVILMCRQNRCHNEVQISAGCCVIIAVDNSFEMWFV
jgi:hypothetical protein